MAVLKANMVEHQFRVNGKIEDKMDLTTNLHLLQIDEISEVKPERIFTNISRNENYDKKILRL